jgi:hypothetical protein
VHCLIFYRSQKMRLRRTAAGYAIIVGLAMIGIWIMLLITEQDQQLQTELRTIPIAISMAITSDFLTAAVLFAAGFGLFKNNEWAGKVLLLAMGFLFYSVINAAGLYGQRGDITFIIMFAVIFILAVIFTVLALQKRSESSL